MERYHCPQQEQAVLEGLQQAFAVYQFIDRRVVTLVLSDGFCRLFGYSDRAKAVYDMDHDMYQDTHPDDVARIANAAVRFATEGGEYDVIYRTRVRGTSDYRVVHAHGVHVTTDTGVRLAHVWYTDEGLYGDSIVADKGRLVRELSSALHGNGFPKASQYDYLTGLPSMTYFFELAEAGKANILNSGSFPVFLFIDLNGMQFFNNKHGFAEGDRYLQAFAHILAKLFSNENCCRFGQDHFGVFTREEGLEDILRRLFAENSLLNNGSSMSVRVGIYPAKIADVPVSAACDRAKIACDVLRRSAGSGFHYFGSELQNDIRRKQYILDHFDQALRENWIQAYYQPIVRTVSHRVCDEEALARWIDPDFGLLPPDAFIPLLEEAGLLYKLDLYILDQVLQKLHRLKEAGLHVMPHSLNLSRSDFEACDIAEEIRRRVDAAGIPRDRITIEITESIIGSDFEFMKQQVARFREMGFPVWMDDFGSGYSSLDVLQSIRFDLIKFDMSFMRKLNEGDSGKIILTELMKMATSLGLDTVCEGVEAEDQLRFLQEIGCSKLQGYYFCRPIPAEEIFERYRKGIQIGFEDPQTSSYYEAVGRINLYDPAVIAGSGGDIFHNSFSTLPMGIIEIQGDKARFSRCNPSYREFMQRFFGISISASDAEYVKFRAGFMKNIIRSGSSGEAPVFYDERMPDGSMVRSLARRIGVHPVTGTVAVAVAVLSVSAPENSADYADIARALAVDYHNIYVVDLDTDRFIEYSSPVGVDELAEERHGSGFFEAAVRDTATRIYEADREVFLKRFNKENIIRELREDGVFTATYRLIDSGVPVYAHMKVTRMQGCNRIIIGVSIIDSQMKQQQQSEEFRRERDMLVRIMALSGDYLSLYSIEPVTGQYIQYTVSEEYASLGLDRKGADFFADGISNGMKVIFPDDLPMYLERFTREKILAEIREKGAFTMRYRLMAGGRVLSAYLKIVSISENGASRLVAGVRLWKERTSG